MPMRSKTKFKIKIGPPKLTRYERARIIGARALQVALGAPVLIKLEENISPDPLLIAERELELGVLPIIIRRKTPSGEYQDIPLKYLLN
ncbi:MAG: DNA-directed RNA polymerase subunit K [Thermoprotei archaeon]|nr:MAG: DNA-directed RNA polymerase subunit K [Thermoprotei archaeon]